MGWLVWVGLWVELIFAQDEGRNITLVQQFCWALQYNLLRTLLYSYSCGSQVKAQPSSGHIFHARTCVRRGHPSEAMEIVSYWTKSGHMFRKLGVGDIPLHHQVMSGDIDDIQEHRYRISRRTWFQLSVKMYHRYYVRGFVWARMALRARNPSPWGLATLTPQSTCHGPRPRPKLARGVRAGSLRATEPRAREKSRGRKRKNA